MGNAIRAGDYMINFEITRINLIGIIKTISSITNEAIIITPCDFLLESLESRNNFVAFDFCCREVSTWYSSNFEYLINNDYPSNDMIHYNNLQKLNEIVKDLNLYGEEYKIYMNPDTKSEKLTVKEENSSLTPKNEVFIVHGRNEDIVQYVARFLQELDLKPIILHEQTNNGDTLIEKIEKWTNVGFAIVIYNPCDLGALSTESENLRGRARQNVVFEHGYLMAKLGRQNICALVVGDVEKPTDISGIIYIEYDKEKSWRNKIGKELQSSGYSVDLNRLSY